jgi:hypothetical protein
MIAGACILPAMSGKTILNALALGCWLFASVVAFMIVAYTSFFGVGVIGLMIWFVSTRVDLEQDGAVGAGVSPGFLAHQLRTRAEMSRAERAALRGQRMLEARSARFFRILGMVLTVGGFAGFWFFQL